MLLIQSSQDLLNVVLAFVALWLAIFVGWFFFYLAMMAREAYRAIRGVNDKIDKAGAVLDAFKEKIEHSASYLLLIGEGVKKLVEVMSKQKTRKKK